MHPLGKARDDMVSYIQGQASTDDTCSIIIDLQRAGSRGLYARYLCSRDALGLKAKRGDRVSCIQRAG